MGLVAKAKTYRADTVDTNSFTRQTMSEFHRDRRRPSIHAINVSLEFESRSSNASSIPIFAFTTRTAAGIVTLCSLRVSE